LENIQTFAIVAAMRNLLLFILCGFFLCGSAFGAESANAAGVVDWSAGWIQTPGAWATLALLAFAKPIGDFVVRHAALKILALSFLVCIGMTLILEGLHKHVDKEYLYLPMGFALLVELLQMRASRNAARRS
jgi:hypothetical protein